MSETSPEATAFLFDLDREIAWQWIWEKRYRRLLFVFVWLTWIVRVLILVIATLQLSSDWKAGEQ